MSVQPISVPPQLARILNSAGERSGVDFDYLVQTAIRESSLNPDARASTSSAVGLFQFVEDTWLQVLKEDGPRLGYGRYADMIERSGDGGYTIRDSGLRQQVLALREDPQMASDLAAAFTKRNGDYLYEQFGRMPSPGELYIAHFLGARGAARMFRAGLEDPNQIAADLFPRAASANRAIFYDHGQPKSIRQVYEALVAKHTTTTPPINSAFDAQRLSGGPAAALTALDAANDAAGDTEPVIPSRFEADPSMMSFTSLYSNDPSSMPATPAPVTNSTPFFDPLAAMERQDDDVPRSRFEDQPFSQ